MIISANQGPFYDFPKMGNWSFLSFSLVQHTQLLMRFFVLVLENEIFVIMLKHFPLYKRHKFLNILKISILEILKIKLRSKVFLFTFHFTFQLLRTWLLLKKSKKSREWIQLELRSFLELKSLARKFGDRIYQHLKSNSNIMLF